MMNETVFKIFLFFFFIFKEIVLVQHFQIFLFSCDFWISLWFSLCVLFYLTSLLAIPIPL